MQVHVPYSVATATVLQVANAPGAFATVRAMATRIPSSVKEARIKYLEQVVETCFSGKNVNLGRRLGHLDGSMVGQWLRGERPISETHLASVASLSEVRTKGLLPPEGVVQVAHGMSLQSLETVPSTTWEQLEMTTGTELPRTFRICIEDSSMAPKVKPGAWVHFNSRESARPGDGVLVRDSTGQAHFRVYRTGRPGAFEAHAENPNFQPLYSERDGLTVLAVLTAVEERWG